MFLSKKSVTFAVSALAMLCSGATFAKEAPQAHKAVELSILHITTTILIWNRTKRELI